VQLVRNGGGIPVGVVSSEAREKLARELGCAAVINRESLGDGGLDGPKGWRRLGEEIRRQAGEDPHIVFERSGRETFGASVYVARRGGTIVTCGSSTGYQHEYDNRHLWMKLKRIVGSHGANYRESWEVNRLITLGMGGARAGPGLPAGRGRRGHPGGAAGPPPRQDVSAVPHARPRSGRRGPGRPRPGRGAPAAAVPGGVRIPAAS
jgi:hypothetical protein